MRHPRQIDIEGGSLARLAVTLDQPFVLLHDAEDEGESEAASLAKRLGREHRIENSLHDIGGNARPFVAHGELHFVLASRQGEANGSPPRRPAGVDRVGHQVGHHLREPPR